MLRLRRIAIKTVGGAIFALAFVIGLFLPGGSASAFSCGVQTHTDVKNVLIKNSAETGDTNAQVTLTGAGVRAKLPDADAKAYVMWDGPNLRLSDLKDVGYWTKKYDTGTVVLPSFQMTLDYNGPVTPGGFTTLVYEPYLNGGVVSAGHTWDAYTGVWWSTRGITDQPDRDTRRTLTQISASNPDAIITSWGVNVGSGNAGADVAWNEITLKAEGCAITHRWKAAEATQSPTANPTHNPTGGPTTNPSQGNVGPSTTPSGGVGGGPRTLPVTGSPLPRILMAVGIGLVVVGGAAVTLWRKKRISFVA